MLGAARPLGGGGAAWLHLGGCTNLAIVAGSGAPCPARKGKSHRPVFEQVLTSRLPGCPWRGCKKPISKDKTMLTVINGTKPAPAPIANYPDLTPELILITAILQALRAVEPPQRGHRRVGTAFDAVAAQVEALASLPLRFCPETVPLRRATAGALAVVERTRAA